MNDANVQTLRPADAKASRATRRAPARNIPLLLTYAFVFFVIVVMAFPLFYMISMGLMTPMESVAIPPPLWSSAPQWGNYAEAWQRVHQFGPYLRTLFVAIAGTLTVLFTGSLAGYGFAKFHWKGQDILFTALLATMTIPLFVNIIPWFWMTRQIGIGGTLPSVLFPYVATAYSVFMMRQFMLDIPDELLDAARMDGASEFGIYARIVLPQVGPGLATLGAFTFLYHWNDLLWPMIMLRDRELWTINLMVLGLQGYGGTGRSMEVAGASLAVIPILILVVLLQRYFVQSATWSGLKG